MLKYCRITTPLGSMIAVGDDLDLYLLEFEDVHTQEKDIAKGETRQSESIKNELKDYFQGTVREFKTPLYLSGTSFQNSVWNELAKIPYGETRAYNEIAKAIDHPKAVRAAGSAIGKNPFCLIIPCHRVIRQSGEIGNYAGGLHRKKWLLEFESLPGRAHNK